MECQINIYYFQKSIFQLKVRQHDRYFFRIFHFLRLFPMFSAFLGTVDILFTSHWRNAFVTRQSLLEFDSIKLYAIEFLLYNICFPLEHCFVRVLFLIHIFHSTYHISSGFKVFFIKTVNFKIPIYL